MTKKITWCVKCLARSRYPVERLGSLIQGDEVPGGEFKLSKPIGGNDRAIEIPRIGDRLGKETYEFKLGMAMVIR